MRVGIPDWEDRVSPVFDVAGRLLIADIESGRIIERQMGELVAKDLMARSRELSELGVEVLICGAISRPLELALCEERIDVVSHICGLVEEVLAAFAENQLRRACFQMPGCCDRRRRMARNSGRNRRGA